MKASQLTKLPPISHQQYKWNGDKKILSHWLRQFQASFGTHPEQQSVHFLKLCIPAEYRKRIEFNYTLQQCLAKLATFAQDSRIYTVEMEDKLKNLPNSKSLAGNAELLQQQITLLHRCIEINKTYFLDLADINLHVMRYHWKGLITKVQDHMKLVTK